MVKEKGKKMLSLFITTRQVTLCDETKVVIFFTKIH